MKQITIVFTFLLLCNFTTAQNVGFTWDSKALFEYGITNWNSDYGQHTNINAGLEYLVYNVNEKNSPIVLTGGLSYMNFYAEDDYDKVTRSLLRVSVGTGLQIWERLFGTVNVGHIWVLDEKEGEPALSTMVASAKVLAVAFKLPKNWQIIINVEAGITFQDVEFRDPGNIGVNGENPDKFSGTGFGKLSIGAAYNWTPNKK